MPESKSSISRRRAITIRLTSLILSANSSSCISTRPASESDLQTCCSSVSSSDRLTALTLVLLTGPETPAPGQFLTALFLSHYSHRTILIALYCDRDLDLAPGSPRVCI